ncbi:unnamed protein product [Candida verbasci]|uniref:Amino acid permease/ SLC12A domain-containing protein n=1 Tax=Candida verbasci TaxID=1227364 RepID=A0A9W4TSL1_9ASCO|nr:unnamed protein product [Candida verbasci]
MSIEKVITKNTHTKSNIEKLDEASYSNSSSNSNKKYGVFTSVVDSFRRAPDDIDTVPKNISKNELRLMAVSTGLGTGLLVASGQRLASAGPVGVLASYAISGLLMLTNMIFGLSEITVAFPGKEGGFQGFFGMFIDESLAFSLGWNYAFQWMCVISLELVTASMTISFWTETINADVWVTIFLVVIIVINFGGAKVYSVVETAFNSCKVIMLVGFILFGLIVDVGGSPAGFIGGRYYHNPGAWTGFKGFASVFVTGAFSLGGSEFISISCAETRNPRTSIRAASKLVYFKVIVLFLGSLCFVGLLVPYTSDRLMGSQGGGSHASPYVLAAELNGIKVLPHIINAVILISVTSVATAAMYSVPRLILSLAKQGLAPKWFDYVDNQGRPARAFGITILSSFFAYIAAYKKQETVFTWLLSISGISFVLCWLFISVCHVRWRAALKYNNISLDSLGFVSPTGLWGSYLSILINFLILVAQFWTSLFPLGGDGSPNALSFFENYLGGPVFVILWAGHKIWTRNWKLFKRVQDIDINTDRTIYDPEILELEKLEEKDKYKRAPFWKKAFITLFD